jgi:hypothetical protein
VTVRVFTHDVPKQIASRTRIAARSSCHCTVGPRRQFLAGLFAGADEFLSQSTSNLLFALHLRPGEVGTPLLCFQVPGKLVALGLCIVAFELSGTDGPLHLAHLALSLPAAPESPEQTSRGADCPDDTGQPVQPGHVASVLASRYAATAGHS